VRTRLQGDLVSGAETDQSAVAREVADIDFLTRHFLFKKHAFADASAPQGVLLEKEVAGEEVNIRDLSSDRTLIRFGTGDEVTLQAGPDGVRFLLISGAPIEEPVAWHGPIVMNTQAEIRQAVSDLQNGTFIKPAH
ncbi:MAG: pirin-like C-terminal cupin domain-containing protein, partial [Pseudomonadota bacterium]